VGIGLLKEGDDAFFNSNSLPFWSRLMMNGLLCVPIYIDAKLPKKLQYFPIIFRNINTKYQFQSKKTALWAGPLVTSAALY
jgi:hypothetical protein